MGAAARPSDWFAWVLLVSFAATNGVTGQATAEPPVDGDPLATDGTDDLANVRVPAPRPPKPRETALLTARPGVRVVDHGVTVDADAFAITFTETLLVENTGAFASDFVYRIPMSGDLAAGVATDDGRVQRRTTTRAGEATADAPERLEITSAALSPGERRTITIAYAAQTSVRDGVLRVRIPPRPADDRDPNLKWASRLGTAWTDAAIDGVPLGRAPSAEGVALWPRFGLELSVKLRRRLASSAGGCTAGGVPHRVVALATPVERPVVARVMLLIDASPSMEGTAQNRVPSTLTALLGRAPVGTWFRPVVFRSTAVPVLDRPFVRAEAVTLGAVEDAAGRATGSATAPDAAWRTASGVDSAMPGAPGGTRWVIVGDGELTDTAETRAALRRLERRREPLFVLNLSDAKTHPLLERAANRSGGAVVRIGERGDRAMKRTEDLPALEEALAVVFAAPRHKRNGRTVFAGESFRTVRSVPKRGANCRAAPELPEPALATHALAELPSGSPGPPPRAPATGIPAESLLSLLRDRIVPAARRCFRADRRGRGDYAVQAKYIFTLRHREVEGARVEGAIEPALRTCLLDAVSSLDIPRFEGTVHVTYPLHTEKAEPLPTLALSDDTAAAVDAVAGDEPTLPPAAP